SRKMWNSYSGICEITSITNAQNKTYWKDDQLEKALADGDDKALLERKKRLKEKLFRFVANQTGKLFRDDRLTIVWARRFAAYKRAGLLLTDFERFLKIARNEKYPVTCTWAGKQWPAASTSINLFNEIYWKKKELHNCAVLTGYELWLSGFLKKGCDVWLNNPRLYREASGTSGMTAAMNATLNLSIPDGWIPEFAKHGENSFIIPTAPKGGAPESVDKIEADNLYDLLEKEVIPTYYDNPTKWWKMVRTSMADIAP